MKKKRIVAVLLASVLALSLMACSKDGKDDTKDVGDTGKAIEAPASTGEKVKITYSIWGTATEEEATQLVADKFNASQDKIEVTVMSIPNENYTTKLNTMATAGQLPDSGMMVEGNVIQWSQNDMLADISSMYEGSDAKPIESVAYKYDGKTVAYSSSNEVLILYYNKDMFDAAGVAYPPTTLENAWTWDEFVATSKKLTVDKNGKHADEADFDSQSITQYGCMVENYTWQLEQYCLSNGGGFYSADGTEVAIDSAASVEAIQKVADLYLKDHVAPLSVGQTDDGVSRSLIAGTCAMTTNGTWNVGTSLPTAKEEGLNYGIAVLPYMKEKVMLNTSGATVVFSQSKHPAEAMEWVKWYSQEENSWSLIESGIWMPILDKYYTDETFTHKWLDNPNFPPYEEYKSVVVDNAISSAAKQAGWYYTNNTADFNTMLTSVLGDVWTGKATAQEAISQNIDQLKAAHDGNK